MVHRLRCWLRRLDTLEGAIVDSRRFGIIDFILLIALNNRLRKPYPRNEYNIGFIALKIFKLNF